jgi:hypothetical protein
MIDNGLLEKIDKRIESYKRSIEYNNQQLSALSCSDSFDIIRAIEWNSEHAKQEIEFFTEIKKMIDWSVKIYSAFSYDESGRKIDEWPDHIITA